MMRLLKSFCLIGLCLALGASSVLMSVSSGQAAAAPGGITLVLCTGDGRATTITLDGDGKPLPAHPHLCPQCLAGCGGFLPPQIDLGLRAAPGFTPVAPPLAALAAPRHDPVPYPARGPPLMF